MSSKKLSGAKRDRGSANTAEWKWKSFSTFPGLPGLTRSFQGNPPRERRTVYDQPYEALSPTQRSAARCVLGVLDEMGWELAMPRRVYGNNEYVVLTFQTVTWDKLSKAQQREAFSELDMTRTFWNERLAPFHDDLWMVDGISLSDKEFSAVLSTLSKLGRQPLTKGKLAQFLQNLGRVLTPSQGVLICETLLHSNCWEILEEPATGDRFNVQTLVASFLSDTYRFLHKISTAQKQIFWNDQNFGCTWGNSNFSINDTRPPYATVLKQKYDKQLALRRCVGPLLTGGGTSHSHLHLHLPELPQIIALSILNEWLGEGQPVDIAAIKWHYCYESSLLDVIDREIKNS